MEPQNSKAKIIKNNITLILVVNILAAFIGAIFGGGGMDGLGYAVSLMFINAGIVAVDLLMAIIRAIGRKGDASAYFLSAILVGIVGFSACYGSLAVLRAVG